jgi:predicted permease
VAIATALTAVAVLLSRSFNELVAVDPGFDADGVMTFTLSPSPEWEGREGLIRYFSTVSAELEAVPGVAGVGIVSDMPFTTENRWTVLERDAQPGDGEEPRAEFHSALPGYFEVMRIPRLAGRFPENPWTAQVPVPVLVNEEMADRFWPAGSALGATFRIQRDTLPYSVVGVVGNELDDGFSAQPDPVFYLPLGSAPSREMWIVLRITGDERGVAESVRAAVARVDADVPAGGLRMLEDLMAETVVRPRAASLIGGVFALLALVIAAAGIYGVLSYTVQSRTREIGIRSALGASREQLVGMVLGQSGRLLLLGLLFGWIGALLAGRAVSGILFGVKSWDPPSLIAATVLLFLAGTAASWIPARRAVRVDPRDALRAE